MRACPRLLTLVVTAIVGLGGLVVPAPDAAGQQRPGTAPPRGRRAPVEAMTLQTSAWPDGGRIPEAFTQAGAEQSPPLTWSPAPEGTASYLLVVRDLDAAVGDGTGEVLQWLVWNIPATATGLPQGVPMSPELPDGTRQISQTGPYYRGPGAMAAGPVHHYVFEVYALDTTLDVRPVGQSPADTLAAVMEAASGHVRGKGALVGLFKRR
ncbi:MAG: YbhB/YbcL family Raf kinase inhibitor-like protein [Vicinamibacterales bacterium]